MYTVCVIAFFVHCHLSLLFAVNRILHVSLSIDNAHVAILYIVKIRLQDPRCIFRKSIKNDDDEEEVPSARSINSLSLFILSENEANVNVYLYLNVLDY